MPKSKGPLKINTDDEALEQLTPVIDSVASRYPNDQRDDVRQACWLRVFTVLRSGRNDLPLLIREAWGAARREARTLNSSGLRPLVSRVTRPHNVGRVPEQSYTPRELDFDGPPTTARGRVLWAMSVLINENEQPTAQAVADRLGMSRRTVARTIQKIRENHASDKDQS